MKKYVFLFSMVVAISACYYDNNSELHPAAGLNTNCDTADITYTNTIAAIYNARCVDGCHDLDTHEGSIVLEAYEYAVLADDNTLIESIEHAPGAIAMPNDGTKLSDCNINQIKIWIQNGKPE